MNLLTSSAPLVASFEGACGRKAFEGDSPALARHKELEAVAGNWQSPRMPGRLERDLEHQLNAELQPPRRRQRVASRSHEPPFEERYGPRGLRTVRGMGLGECVLFGPKL